MKTILTGVIAFIAGALLVFYFVKAKSAGGGSDEGETASPVQLKHGANGETMVVLDAETQKRLGLKTEMPAASQWQPEIKGYGRIVDPATLASAVADLESARTASAASTNEYERLKNLAAQNNVSARNLEAAKATATHDELAFESARAKFKMDWGERLAENSADILSAITDKKSSLAQIELPAGEALKSSTSAAEIFLDGNSNFISAEFFDAGLGVDPQTQKQKLLLLARQAMTPGAAISAALKISGEPAAGAIVPFSAVLRYEGKNWIYVQTAETDFARREIETDSSAENGWFVAGDLTNRVVVTGAQAVLSAELSTGGFNTGTRD